MPGLDLHRLSLVQGSVYSKASIERGRIRCRHELEMIPRIRVYTDVVGLSSPRGKVPCTILPSYALRTCPRSRATVTRHPPRDFEQATVNWVSSHTYNSRHQLPRYRFRASFGFSSALVRVSWLKVLSTSFRTRVEHRPIHSIAVNRLSSHQHEDHGQAAEGRAGGQNVLELRVLSAQNSTGAICRARSSRTR